MEVMDKTNVCIQPLISCIQLRVYICVFLCFCVCVCVCECVCRVYMQVGMRDVCGLGGLCHNNKPLHVISAPLDAVVTPGRYLLTGSVTH